MADNLQSSYSEGTPLFTQFKTDDFTDQLPASLFVLNLLFLKSLRLVVDQAMHYGQSHSIKQ